MKNRFKVAKWIMLSLAILANAFIIAYSCLSQETTNKWQRAITNIFTKLVNDVTEKEVKTTPLENINIGFSGDQYNNIPGYKLEEIPLGSAKEVKCTFTPDDATNKAIKYSVEPADIATLNQSGSTLSIVGMKAGVAKLTATSNDGGFKSEVDFKVVETVAPTSFAASIASSDIAIGTTQTIDFVIDGGVLGKNELINFRYYDTRKLSYSSLDEGVAKVDNYGVIYPQSVGSTTITVTNGTITKTFDINVTSGTPVPTYSSLSISGSNVCYANDMLMDQSKHKDVDCMYCKQLTPKDGDTLLNPEDFIWESSNELLVKVDKHGKMRGFRKTKNDDETAVITAISKLTGQTASFDVVVKNQLPTEMYFSFDIGDKTIWNPTEYTLSVGDVITVKLGYKPNTQQKDVLIDCSDTSVIEVSNEGANIILNVRKEGTCTIKMTSVINPNLSMQTKYTVVKAGAISTSDVTEVGMSLRKTIGHAAVFTVAQIFTYLTLFMFFYEKPWWFHASISLGTGLAISGISEFIQYLVPSRHGTMLDVLINFAGAFVGAVLTFLGILIVKKIVQKRKEKNDTKEN